MSRAVKTNTSSSGWSSRTISSRAIPSISPIFKSSNITSRAHGGSLRLGKAPTGGGLVEIEVPAPEG